MAGTLRSVPFVTTVGDSFLVEVVDLPHNPLGPLTAHSVGAGTKGLSEHPLSDGRAPLFYGEGFSGEPIYHPEDITEGLSS